MNKLKLVVCSGVLFASTAMAAVTFDPSTASGFVGKGDVQLALGWNNSMLQSNIGSVSFQYIATDVYTATCTFITGEGTRGEKTHNVAHKTTTGVNRTVAYDPRVKNQITGFNLNGKGDSVTTGTIPEIGGACQGNEGHGGTWSSVSLTSSTSGLYVTSGGTPVKIWPPQVAM